MSDSVKRPKQSKQPEPTTGFARRTFLKGSVLGIGGVAATSLLEACSTSSNDSSVAATPAAPAAVNPATGLSSNAWKFAVMADTQWLSTDDGYNPNTSAIAIIQALQQRFIGHGVKFVVQVGDLADRADTASSSEAGYATTPVVCEDTRALFAQPLYNAGIGFFPVRGNHDNLAADEFVSIFPQTKGGNMNATPAAALAVANPDTANQPSPVAAGAAFQLGKNFSSPGTANGLANNNLAGLSYAFDFANARLVFIDQFQPGASTDGNGPDGNPYSLKTTAKLQQPWISQVLSGKPASVAHAFVFAHKGLITQQHQDVLFGDQPGDADYQYTNSGGTLVTMKAAAGMNDFIRSMASNGARLYFCGHDHIYNRSLVYTTDDAGLSHVTHVLCSSNSSKFYTPNEQNDIGNTPVTKLTSNNAFYCAGKRQVQLSQELYTVGYYVVTVDGDNVTVDYYSAPVYPTYSASTENLITSTPTLNFSLRESFGYGVGGNEYVVDQGGAFTVVNETSPGGTTAKILAGTNGSLVRDLSGTKYKVAVNTGWAPKVQGGHSDVLVLRGMDYDLGSTETDAFALAMSYDGTGLTDAEIVDGNFCLAALDATGKWSNAVDANVGGTKKFVKGPWTSGAALGSYGVDTATKTVWAVINHNSEYVAGYVA